MAIGAGLAIQGAGCICPIGLSLPEAAAAARARMANLREIAWQDRRNHPFIVGQIPESGLPPLHAALDTLGLQSREKRMLRMAHVALEETLRALPADSPPIPLLLGLPEHPTHIPIDPGQFIERLATQTGIAFDLPRSQAVAHGRATGLMALAQAGQRLIQEGTPWVLIGGVDSLVDPYVLGSLDLAQRIRHDTNSDGFSPAEGAAFLLLGRDDTALPPLGRITAYALAHEPGHLYSDAAYLGEGLATTFARLFAQRAPDAPIATCFSSMNGERYWAREFGVARLRHASFFADDLIMEHPAECFGDLGAAHGPALMALALHAMRSGYRPHPMIVYASSDRGARAACMLEPT